MIFGVAKIVVRKLVILDSGAAFAHITPIMMSRHDRKAGTLRARGLRRLGFHPDQIVEKN